MADRIPITMHVDPELVEQPEEVKKSWNFNIGVYRGVLLAALLVLIVVLIFYTWSRRKEEPERVERVERPVRPQPAKTPTPPASAATGAPKAEPEPDNTNREEILKWQKKLAEVAEPEEMTTPAPEEPKPAEVAPTPTETHIVERKKCAKPRCNAYALEEQAHCRAHST